MSYKWRDTLFIWKGGVAPSRPEGGHEIVNWKGSWIACRNCPDARKAYTPTDRAFRKSDMTFDVSGILAYDKKVKVYTLDMTTGTGWDLINAEDTDNDDSDDEDEGEKTVHQDDEHEIMFAKLPWQPKYHDEKIRPLIVAKGTNEFGNFISVGYQLPRSNGNAGRMILARRYLDDKDVRGSWTCRELYRRARMNDPGSVEMFPGAMHSVLNTWRIGPWRTLDFHSNILKEAPPIVNKKKRKRKEDEDVTEEPMPPLRFPRSKGKPKLQIPRYSEERYDDNPFVICEGIAGHEQCYGCGREVNNPENASCLEIREWTLPKKPRREVGWVMYCSPRCVQKHGAKTITEACNGWAVGIVDPNYRLTINASSTFWDTVKSDPTEWNRFQKAGWKLDGDDYVFYGRKKK